MMNYILSSYLVIFSSIPVQGKLPYVDRPVQTGHQNQDIDFRRDTRKTLSTTGYSHENVSVIDNSNWMSNMSDDTHLMSLSLPGTHESMALLGGDIPQCQSLSIKSQLKAGIRVFDIRCRHKGNRFRIQNQYFDERIEFSDVLDIFVDFLSQNPSEVVFVRVKEELKSNSNNNSFENTFKEYITNESFKSFIWEPNSLNPLLSAVRGKVVIIQDFLSTGMYGLDYKLFDIQDEYEVKSIFGLYDKWEKVKKQLIKSDKHKEEVYYVNYLSGSTAYLGQIPLFVFPYFVAGGRSDHRTDSPLLLTGRTTLVRKDVYPDFPRIYCLGSFCLIAFEGTNDLTLKYIQNERPEFVGILMIDFPGDALIDAIIRLNKFEKTLSEKQNHLSTEKTEINSQTSDVSIDPLIDEQISTQTSNSIERGYDFVDTNRNNTINDNSFIEDMIAIEKSNDKTNDKVLNSNLLVKTENIKKY